MVELQRKNKHSKHSKKSNKNKKADEGPLPASPPLNSTGNVTVGALPVAPSAPAGEGKT